MHGRRPAAVDSERREKPRPGRSVLVFEYDFVGQSGGRRSFEPPFEVGVSAVAEYFFPAAGHGHNVCPSVF